MKKWAGVFIGLLLFPFALFAQEISGEEIPNQVDAIMSAQPGDYILLPSGNRYVLTKEEIMIMNGTFGYENLSDVASETKADGTVKITISQAHEIYIYPDGRTVHVLKTRAALAYSLRFIEENYHLMRYLDSSGILHDSKPIDPLGFNVFRVFVQFETITNEFTKLDVMAINIYNYEGRNFTTKYSSTPNLVWGMVSSEGSYRNADRIIDENWEIPTPGSALFSFELDQYLSDSDIIAIETILPGDASFEYKEKPTLAAGGIGNEMPRLNTSQPIYQLLVIDRVKCPNSDISDVGSIKVLYKFKHGRNGYLIALYVSPAGGPVFPKLPARSRIVLNLSTSRPATIREYINSNAFRKFVTNRTITRRLQEALRKR
jgi:hypothetical protein